MPQPIQYSGEHIDFSPRFYYSAAVAGSPALAAETVVCTLTASGDLAVGKGVLLSGWLAFTVGTSGTTAVVRLRQTGTSGTIVAATGAQNVTAADLRSYAIQGIDAAPVLPGQVYVLTLQIANGAAVSTVSATNLSALVL